MKLLALIITILLTSASFSIAIPIRPSGSSTNSPSNRKPFTQSRNSKGLFASTKPGARKTRTCVPALVLSLQVLENENLNISNATKHAHQAQNGCPESMGTKFGRMTDLAAKETMASNCIKSWSIAASYRQKANLACINMGGTPDWGHLNAVKFCENKVKFWTKQKELLNAQDNNRPNSHPNSNPNSKPQILNSTEQMS